MGFWLGIRFPNAAMTGTEGGEGGGSKREPGEGEKGEKRHGVEATLTTQESRGSLCIYME